MGRIRSIDQRSIRRIEIHNDAFRPVAAENLIHAAVQIKTGASSDIRQARYFMKTSLNEYAMGDKLYARWTQEEIEQEMHKQYQRTCEMIRRNRPVLDALTG